MPELPELEVVCEVLNRRVLDLPISHVVVLPPGGPVVVRDLTTLGFSAQFIGKSFTRIFRRGKYLVFTLSPSPEPLFFVVNPKLTGRLQLTESTAKRMPKTHVIFSLPQGLELRYVDFKRMGQLYLTHQLDSVPEFSAMGTEALEISLEDFKNRLHHFHGEIKGALTRGAFLAGIGNAYADEILWAARLYPYRRISQLSPGEVERLYTAIHETLSAAIEIIRKEMGENIHLKPREFMAVHMKTGQPCPRCGTTISLVGANQRITNFCRTCQPGGLTRGIASPST